MVPLKDAPNNDIRIMCNKSMPAKWQKKIIIKGGQAQSQTAIGHTHSVSQKGECGIRESSSGLLGHNEAY